MNGTKTKTGIFTVFVALTTVTTSAFGALTGSITISGSVAAATAITVTSSPGYNTLDLSNSVTDLQVASVRETNNTTLGYRVTLTSANAGQLKNGSVGSLAYSAKYNGASVTLSTTPQTITNTGNSNTVVNVLKPLAISYTGAAANTMMAGTYSDTLTFTIAAN